MLPDGWSDISLGDAFSFKNGLNGDKELYGAGTKFVNVMDVFRGPRLRLSEIVGSMKISPKQLSAYAVQYGDVLLNRTSETRDEIALATVYLDTAPAVFGGFVIRARPTNDDTLPEFCVYGFQSAAMRRAMIRLGQGAIRANIGQGDLSKVTWRLPPISEQQRIAAILSTWDRAIETVEALIAGARAQKQALMQQLLPQGTTPPKKRLPGFSGEWREASLAELLSVKRAKGKIVPTNQDGDGVPYIGSTSFLGEFSNYTTSQDALLCVETDILVLWDGEYAGKVATGLTGAVSSTVGRYRLAKAKADPVFVVTLMEKASERIRSIREGSGIPHVPGDFEHWFKFAMPPLDEQQAIAEVFRANLVATEALQSQLTALHQEKSALMQQLLTGKRRVKVNESEDG